MNIWQFQANILNKRLRRWAAFSIITGLLLQLQPQKFWKNLGWQFAGWGLINAGIAFFGQIASQEQIAQLDNPGAFSERKKQSSNLKKILLINSMLDVLYVLGGIMTLRADKGEGGRAGTGWGVIIQGAFLLGFDLLHAQILPDEDDSL